MSTDDAEGVVDGRRGAPANRSKVLAEPAPPEASHPGTAPEGMPDRGFTMAVAGRNLATQTPVSTGVAQAALRTAANVAGDFFVDSSCIDCDTCRQIAPTVFHDVGDQSAVFHQPESDEELLAAQKALIACPTASIGDVRKRDASQAIASYPELIEDDVYRCGFTSESSFGAFSYLTRRLPLPEHVSLHRRSLAWSEARGHLYAFRSACWLMERADRLDEAIARLPLRMGPARPWASHPPRRRRHARQPRTVHRVDGNGVNG